MTDAASIPSLMIKLIDRVKKLRETLRAALARPGAGSGLASQRVFSYFGPLVPVTASRPNLP